jgi:hypothetical protein
MVMKHSCRFVECFAEQETIEIETELELSEKEKACRRKEAEIRELTERAANSEAEIRELKEALYSDLEKGWMTGDFRMEVEHVDALREGIAKIPLENLEKIYLYYRSMQNETISRV